MTTEQHNKAWDAINSTTRLYITRKMEFNRLLAFHNAKKSAPHSNFQGRSMVKGRAKGYGQILKSSFVRSVNPEKHFPKVF